MNTKTADTIIIENALHKIFDNMFHSLNPNYEIVEADDTDDDYEEENMMEDNVRPIVDSNGYFNLKPTKEGSAKIDQFREAVAINKKRKILFDDHGEYMPEIDLKPLDDSLTKVLSYCEAGKYGKAKKAMNYSAFGEFLNIYIGMSKDDKYIKQFNRRAQIILRIAKSFYEYDVNHTFLDDRIYDTLIEKYRHCGGTEPTGVVPSGKKNLKKIDITYPTLHNNMDKSYAVRDSDDIPKGVKESDTVESFLRRVYKTIDIPETEAIAIEVSPKIDGVSINGTVDSETGRLINVQTRGDQEESVSVIGMNGIEVGKAKDVDSDFGIQYECFVTNDNRLKASEYLGLEEPYRSCRHAVAGLTHRLSTMDDPELLQYLSLYPINTEGLDEKYADRVKLIQKFGIVPKDMHDRIILKGNMKELMKEIADQFEQFNDSRSDSSYEFDGIVITVVSDKYQQMLGRNGRTNKFQIALKFNPTTAEGIADSIELVPGKKGFRTIQLKLKTPVHIDGIRYDHIPILSYEIFKDFNLKKGSTVKVVRVGDVIPAISVVDLGNGPKITTPKYCPFCGNELKIKAKKLYCDNYSCNGNILGKFTNFFETLDMKSYNEAFAKLLIDEFHMTSFNDFFKLTEQQIKESKINSKKLHEFRDAVIDALKNHYDYEILTALAIPEIGAEKSKALTDAGFSFKNLADCIKSGKSDDVYKEFRKTLKDTTDEKLNKLYDKFTEFTTKNKDFDQDVLVIAPYIEKVSVGKFVKKIGHSGGGLSEDVKSLCNKMNFMITDGRKFDILIVPNKAQQSTKTQIAEKKKLPILTEDEFMEQYVV